MRLGANGALSQASMHLVVGRMLPWATDGANWAPVTVNDQCAPKVGWAAGPLVVAALLWLSVAPSQPNPHLGAIGSAGAMLCRGALGRSSVGQTSEPMSAWPKATDKQTMVVICRCPEPCAARIWASESTSLMFSGLQSAVA